MNVMYLETIARAVHEVNRCYRESIGEVPGPHWDVAPESMQESVLAGVKAVVVGEIVCGEGSHEGWLKRKYDEGWVYGPEKDEEAKTHPCMLPWERLPKEQRVKDALFVAIASQISIGSTVVQGLRPRRGLVMSNMGMAAAAHSIRANPNAGMSYEPGTRKEDPPY